MSNTTVLLYTRAIDAAARPLQNFVTLCKALAVQLVQL
jgi:hypothetical protein